MIAAGRVSVNGKLQRDPEYPISIARDQITLDGQPAQAAPRTYIALNKPRGLIVTTADERGRDTIYSLLQSAQLPWLAPVGRLDKASEGLLLLSNDPEWAAGITEPSGKLLKTYHVQISGSADQAMLDVMLSGIDDAGEHLSAVSVKRLRAGAKNTWLEVVLDEGRNRHIRRLLNALDHEALRLVRIAIGPVTLGTLAKGQWRQLSISEATQLATPRAR